VFNYTQIDRVFKKNADVVIRVLLNGNDSAFEESNDAPRLPRPRRVDWTRQMDVEPTIPGSGMCIVMLYCSCSQILISESTRYWSS
jgi:hypothetical protein